MSVISMITLINRRDVTRPSRRSMAPTSTGCMIPSPDSSNMSNTARMLRTWSSGSTSTLVTVRTSDPEMTLSIDADMLSGLLPRVRRLRRGGIGTTFPPDAPGEESRGERFALPPEARVPSPSNVTTPRGEAGGSTAAPVSSEATELRESGARGSALAEDDIVRCIAYRSLAPRPAWPTEHCYRGALADPLLGCRLIPQQQEQQEQQQQQQQPFTPSCSTSWAAAPSRSPTWAGGLPLQSSLDPSSSTSVQPCFPNAALHEYL